ncbi:hypothetical protein NP493_912g00059 [Ridgeia piscesae]|uniref:Fucolectin tachylectin-4 pentraxin-1 domain-containing protein n=1 Tax=Ridgeia piscesae TaxID=27915 RepID=A0AAD9KK34_RIDPI|nr:hypothetical protein NP493_912g00059 [Ridgeia piscesae]
MSPARTKCVSRVTAVVGGLLLHTFMVDQVVTGLNIALRQPAFMSSLWSTDYASRGVDGNKTSFFHTNTTMPNWWGIDFGLEDQLVTRVNVTNRKSVYWYIRVKSFVIGLTNHDPRKDGGPLNNAFSVCAIARDQWVTEKPSLSRAQTN